ncbi:uncharacterized protein LOC143517977 isoform X2 [Brachyhypopomus gauderio]|uniref:uncharacterized protein LOC143517977 isoform X2 n=1 Tax=Brachyhypopomus gauderio TaxID=698409 RepID=UPI00404383C7
MASLCKRQICTNTKHGVCQDLDSWRFSLIRCVGIEKILDLLHGTRVLEDLRLFKDYKPASVSNWFDENCLFCCLRREKVKEHVDALTNKIVESGGKPLLGKDHYNTRLEYQVEEFLNAVLHRKEYTPRIPDPHIPVVACDTMHQMIGQLVVHYTSNDSQGSPRHNGNTDQSLLKARSITSPNVAATAIASAQNPVLSKLLMADQDAPLDLSLKKVKPEVTEQDGVLDLSIKKNRNQDDVSPKKHMNMNFTTGKRDSLDLDLVKVRDLQSSSRLEHFMAKLCLHHQRQIIDAFGFLQTEVRAEASSSNCQVPSSVLPEKTPTPDVSQAIFEEQSDIQEFEETPMLSGAVNKPEVQESAFDKSNEPAEQPSKSDRSLIPSVKTGPPIDLRKGIGDDVSLPSDSVAVEHGSTNFQPKCPTLLIVKNRSSGNLEAKNVPEVCSRIHHNSGTLEQDLCTSDTQLQATGSESDIMEVSSLSLGHEHSEPKFCTVERSLPAHGQDSTVRHCSDQRTSNVISPIFPRTARKSKRASRLRQRDSLICPLINDPDINCDIVYVGKPITECERQSQNGMLPRKNARKSTRGHLYIGECWEIKTVRTLAGKPAVNGSGNCHVPVPEMTTSVTPKHALAKPDGVPPMDIPFTGDCIETVMNKKSSDQPVETEMPGDVVEIENDHLIVETSQTGQTQIKEHISSVLASDQNDASVQQNSNARIPGSVSDHSEPDHGNPMDTNVANINGPTEIVEAPKETVEAPVSDVISDGLEHEIQSQNLPTESLSDTVSSDIAKDDRSNPEGVEPRCDSKELNSTTNDFQTEALQQTEHLETPAGTYTDKNAELHIIGRSETKLQTENIKLTQDTIVDSKMPELNIETAIKEVPKEGLVPNTLGFSTKKVITKPAFSDRCLRSRSNQKIVTETPGLKEPSDLQSDVQDLNTPDSKRPLKCLKLKPTEDDAPCVDGQNGENVTENVERTQGSPVATSSDVLSKMDMVCARKTRRFIMTVKEAEIDKEQMVLEIPKNEPTLESHDLAENVGVSRPEADKSLENKVPGKSLKVPERMPLRNRTSQVEQPSSKASCSAVKNITQTSERMPLRNRNSGVVDQIISGDFGCPPTGGHLERMPLRSRNSCVTEHVVSKDSSVFPNKSSSETATRPPQRSKNSTTVQQVTEESLDVIADASSSLTEQTISEDLSITSKKTESTGHMPLRSGNVSVAEHPSNTNSCALTVGNVSESPGRMSLRRSNTSVAEKPDHSATPPKIKKLSQRPPRLSKISTPSSDLEAEQNPSIAKCKTDKLFKGRTADSSLPENSLISVTVPLASPAIPSQSRFLEVLNGEENRHLISDLNTKFEKMQKGWVQMDKEGQPAPRPKNRADRLKEIWKSKRRIRKPRSLEQQKFSPVQTLFMKSFDLPSICRWFLQTTETKSLVIVKKVNTRLPSETQLCFHTSASVPGTSNGVFPSLQAERLKKHLKKFAIASPVKSNPKTKRLIAKALAHEVCISQGKEKRESITATRISTKPHCYTSLIQTQLPETHNKGTVVVKNPASARILRKYSNMREKMQVQQNTLKHLGSSQEETKQAHLMPKNVSKEKLSTGKGQKSAIVKTVKALAKKVKAKSSVKVRIPKRSVSRALRDLNDKDGVPPKGTFPKVAKINPVTATKTLSKKEIPMKTDKSPQAKQDIKRSPLSKGSDLSPSQNASTKPLSEDQVLTRSQRKIEATLTQTGSLKTTAKRGTEPLVSSAKRTRTSK